MTEAQAVGPLTLPQELRDLIAEFAPDLDRISRHLVCLERAAGDETADPRARAVVAADVAMYRSLLKLMGVES